MTQRRRRSGFGPAVLVALAVGASTAGVTTVVAVPQVPPAIPDQVTLDILRTTPRPTPAPIDPPPTDIPTPITSEPPTTTTTTTVPVTTTSARPTTTTSRPPADTAAPAQVLAITNAERADAGCAPLTMDSRLTQAAQAHSADMSAKDYFSHTSPDGRTFVDRAKAAGYPSPGAENIAKGQRTPEKVMAAWMASAGHRANILNCGLKTMGLGLDTDGYYWTQVFGR
ncbi:CAP domain-containing protein [Actinokineospora sp.]|uniref:CAP domain-containing protein n=1 Tax=Actinokineospora sp. TaxID=1872133 RepID=UPI0040381EFB